MQEIYLSEREYVVPFWNIYSGEDIEDSYHLITALHEMKTLPRVVITEETDK